MKYAKRFVAFALSLVVAFGAVMYRPPEAHAVIAESALVSAAISTYLSASGFEFFGGSNNLESNQLIHAALCEYLKAYAESIDQLNSEVQSVLIRGVTVLENGVMKFTAEAANLLGGFQEWLLDKVGLLTSSGEPIHSVPVYLPTLNAEYLKYGEFTLPNINSVWDISKYQYSFISYNGEDFTLYFVDSAFKSYNVILPSGDEQLWLYADNSVHNYCAYTFNAGDNEWVFNRKNPWGSISSIEYPLTDSAQSIIWTSISIYNGEREDELLIAYDAPISADINQPVWYGVSLAPDYALPNEIVNGSTVTIDTGLQYEDDQTFADSIVNGIVSGSFAPTIENVGSGDLAVPDEDEDGVGILNWVKKIHQSVLELPRTIADAVANVFVPSAEYMAVLPETITSTFDNRTGFLTYPVSALHDFIDRLSAGEQDFILSWPNVYEPFTNGKLISAGLLNVSEYVREHSSVNDLYTIYKWVVSGYLTFLFLGLCKRKYYAIISG